MEDVESSLSSRWSQACLRRSVPDDVAAQGLATIVDAHTEPHRRYHDLRHLDECFGVIDSLTDLGPRDRDLAEWAIWFHDIVYDPTEGDNEALSAEVCAAWMERAGLEDRDVVVELIEMTAGHQVGRASPAHVAVHDADLAILGASAERYAEYAAAIRVEYGHLREDEFRLGRRRVLEGMLRRSSLYLHPDVAGRLEHRARANMTAELTDLPKPVA